MLLSRQWGGMGFFKVFRPYPKEIEERARDLIHFLLLDAVIEEQAGNLSGGQQRLLELGMP